MIVAAATPRLTVPAEADSVPAVVTLDRRVPGPRWRRWLGFLLPIVALAPASASAQALTSPGSLTVLSRPAGAACRISGDRIVVGRTPFTLERGLAGRFQVRAVEPGFERWQRSILLDGVSADTLWMTLQAKNGTKAGMRSLLMPGWGQFYSQRSSAGWVYFLATAAAAGGAVAAHLEYEDRVDEIDAALSLEDRQRATQRAEDAYDTRQTMTAVAAGVWAVNVLDAVVFFPDFGTGGLQIGFEGSNGRAGASRAALAMKVRF